MFQNNSYSLSSIKVQPSDYSILFANGEKLQLQPKLIEVLGYLASQYPRVVPREEIIENVWAGNSYVGEKALTNAIWNLRQKLKQHEQTEIIETIRKSGYRLLVKPELDAPIDEITTGVLPRSQTVAKDKRTTNKWRFTTSIYAFASFALLYFIWHQIAIHNSIKEPIFEQITTEPGSELFTSPSPDGRFIVYQWNDHQGISNLFMRDRTQPQLKAQQLTFDDAKQGFSVWSSDGDYLYFARKDKTNNSCELVQMQVKTHEDKVIAQCPKKGGYYYIDISADGKTLAFHGRKQSDDSAGIYFLDLTSKGLSQKRFSCTVNCSHRDRDMSFSPDGKFIAVSRRFSSFEENIFLINLASKQETQLTFNEEDIVGMTWHPSGKHIVFATQRADVRKGYMVKPDTGEITNLNIEGFSYPKYSSQSAELFFQHRLEHYQVSSLSVNSDFPSSPFPVLQSKFNHLSPDYSSVHNKIIYVSNESGFYEVWASNHDGSKREQLTFLEDTVRHPKWSNDGTKVAFLSASRTDKGDKIYILDFKSKKLKQLNSQFNQHNRPTWSYDDKSIITAVYTDEYTDLHKFELLSGESKRLTFDGARSGVLSQNDTLYYTRVSGGLYKRNLSSVKSDSINIINRNKLNSTYSWVYTKHGVYFNHHEGNSTQLFFYNFNDMSYTAFIKQPRNSVADSTNLTHIEDKQLLLFTGESFPQADISKLQHPKLL
ncbi:winged helix-turn-helix domain-containing protein [Thalassotalea psychrophila]|uniref:Winged helix-turn-helix domain-containing protein n=1 Tax=Thalassotalea psychrophila TaxID=3065647 RepID=A0ABY9TPI1_9GAMM|nr:winged helix-turn-helix domain-containing protein [Colwelliaceae bacterium SQ149]